jgi:hypothetical protein
VTIVEIEHDGIGRRLVPAMLAANLRGADHGLTTMDGVPSVAVQKSASSWPTSSSCGLLNQKPH